MVLLLLALLLPLAASAQCPGDLNEDGAVSVAELVTAVHSALHGCAPPSPTPTVNAACPEDFRQPTTELLCTYHGPISFFCDEQIDVQWYGDGDYGLMFLPLLNLYLLGAVDNETGRISLDHFAMRDDLVDLGRHLQPGRASFNTNGNDLTLFPGEYPIIIRQCRMGGFRGTLTRTDTLSAADDARYRRILSAYRAIVR